MNKYTQYMIRQYFLNQLIPPHPSHTIMGSHFLYDLVTMHFFFKFKSTKEVPTTIPSITPSKPSFKESYEEGIKNREEMFKNFMNFEPNNILIKLLLLPIKLWCKYIVGFISVTNNLCKRLGS